VSITERDNQDIIGREDLNDIEAILSITNTDVDEVLHAVRDDSDALFTWDYSLARPNLRRLYEKAKVGQWNGTTDLPWDTAVDVEATIAADQAAIGAGIDPARYAGTPVAKWSDKEWIEFGIEGRRWSLSQFLHGEQGALLCTRRSPRPSRGTTRSSTRARRSSTRRVTSRCSRVTSTRSWAVATK
jgi:hypothetical protein